MSILKPLLGHYYYQLWVKKTWGKKQNHVKQDCKFSHNIRLCHCIKLWAWYRSDIELCRNMTTNVYFIRSIADLTK